MKSQSILLILTAALCLFMTPNGFGQPTDYMPNQILIQFKSDKSNSQKQHFKNQIKAQTLKTFPQFNTELLTIDTNTEDVDIQKLIKKYSTDTNVEKVQANYIYSLQNTPDDPDFNTLWALHNTGQTDGTPDVDIDALEAWGITTGSPSVVVGVMDTGIDWRHEDLIENIWQNLGEDADGDGHVLEWNGETWVFDPGDINNWDDDGNGYKDDFIGWDFRNNDNNPFDGHSHGTHVAGTIGARGNNGIGTTGVTWDVQLAALKFLSNDGLGTTADAIQALDYAIDMNIPLTNNSWGGLRYDSLLYETIEIARNNGHIFIAAAGNNGINNDAIPVYPASYDLDNIISVTAINDQDNMPNFANYGTNSVDLAAPGEGIYSCLPENGYNLASGTSSATPYVTGACALLWEQYPNKSYIDIKNAILNSVVTTPQLTGKCQSNGRLNLYNSLNYFDLLNCRGNDSLVLVALYNATNGANWSNAWNLNLPMNTWDGVALNDNGCVEKLLLSQNNLVGNIPIEIGNLTNIVKINLGRNKLSGHLPAEIGNLRKLEHLGLGGNNFTGNIPTELGNLSNLENLGLGGSQFTGNIPVEFGNLTNLTQLWLDDNLLSGTLPSELGNLYKLTHLHIKNNNFDGNLPAELAYLTKLKYWDISNNNFSGCFDASLENLCNTLDADYSVDARVSADNSFDITWEQFCIQGSCYAYSSCRKSDSLALVALYDATNGNAWIKPWNLNQPIDTWHGVTLNGYGCVDSLDLYGNNLVGTIPPEIGDFYNLESINFGRNKLSGHLPSEIENLRELRYLGLGGNQLSGNIPIGITSLSKLINLGLGGNQFTGSLPAEIGNLSNLEQLWLNANPLSGSIPPELGKLHKLTHLIIPENNFSGSLPPELSQLSSLRYWDLSNNNFSGCFHPDLAVLCNSLNPNFSKNKYVNEGNDLLDTNWESFCDNTSPPCDCQYVDSLALVKLYHATDGENWNIKWDLTQPYTTWYGLVFNANGCVSEIVFEANGLNGTLPPEIGNFSDLTGLELNDNQLHGTIPPELGKLSNLTLLWLPGNQFTGNIPAELGHLNNLTQFSVAQNQMSGCFAPELANLCSSLTNTNVANGNSFDATWADFCTNQAGICGKYSACRQADSLALVALYNATNGPNWRNTWTLSDPINTWIGVDLNENGCVSTLNLYNNELSGTIPTQIGNLSYLTHLNLAINTLTGNIPSAIGDLEHLEILYLYHNQLSGNIPPELGDLTNLVEMNIGQNPLTGSIPPEIGNLINLVDLHIHITQLTGSIPPELGNLNNLRYLYMYDNKLSGSIPSELGDLSNLELLKISQNQLTGSIPPELGKLINLEKLYLYYNQLSGNIPPELGNLSSLIEMNIGQNPLTGSIPPELGNLFNLVSLHIHYSNVSGSIPPELGNLSHLRHFYVYNNPQLSGNIPPELGNLTNLELLNISLNQLTGSIPAELGALYRLRKLYLYANQLSGNIPPKLGDLSNLIEMNIGQNPLTGNIPTEIGNLYNLESLHIHYSDVIGSIPTEIGNLIHLHSLYIYNNKMSGNIPSSLSNLTNLKILNISRNQFTGSIPTEFGNLTKLTHLYINNNQLTGNIPTSFGNLKKLERLDLHVNKLSGSIPPTFGGLYQLNTLYLFNNQLSGCYANLTNLCNQLTSASNGISNGNSFDVTWEDFCNEGLGVCPDYVWPGDANYDGIVGLSDFLYVGLANGNNGPARPNASTNWIAQSCAEWQVGVNEVNGKHQDTDGNGLVDTLDFQAIRDNYGETHRFDLSNSVPDVIIFRPDNFIITGTGGAYLIEFDLHLESAGQPIEAHGISALIDFGKLPVANAYLDITTSFLEPHEDLQVFDKDNNTLAVALTRTDGTNRTIAGPIAKGYGVILSKNLPTGEGSIGFNGGNLMTADGTLESLGNTTFYSPLILSEDVGVQSEELAVRVNVTHEQCTIPGKASAQVTGGVAPYTYTWSTGSNTAQINNLSAGTYTVTVNDALNTTDIMTVEVEANYLPTYDENGNLVDCNTALHLRPQLYLALQGPYDTLTNAMTNNLQRLNILPNRQPYHQAPWNYQGTEGMNWNSEDYPEGSVDWVLVSFRTEPTVGTEVAQAAAILLQNGSLSFHSNYIPLTHYADSLYVNIKHRNHVAITTPSPIKVINNTLAYDFRVRDSYKTQTSSGQKQLSNGLWCMFAGDCSQSGEVGYDINGSDKSIWSGNNGSFGDYIESDFNLDGDVSGSDKGIWSENNGINSSVPR